MRRSQTHSSNSSQKLWRLNLKLSRIISRRPGCSKRQWDIGCRPARRWPCAPPTLRPSRTRSEALGYFADGAEKDRLELDFQLALGPCLIAIQGPASNKAVATFARARELCERLGEAPRDLKRMFWLG